MKIYLLLWLISISYGLKQRRKALFQWREVRKKRLIKISTKRVRLFRERDVHVLMGGCERRSTIIIINYILIVIYYRKYKHTYTHTHQTYFHLIILIPSKYHNTPPSKLKPLVCLFMCRCLTPRPSRTSERSIRISKVKVYYYYTHISLYIL